MDTTGDIVTRYRPPSAAVIWFVRLVALGGLGLSSVLAFKSGGLPGCGTGSGCDEVLTSAYAKWLGLPVAMLSVVVYGLIVVGTTYIPSARPQEQQRAGWIGLIVLTGSAALAALWFIGVQAFAIGAACKYCLAVHACSLVLFATVLLTAPIGRTRVLPDEPRDPMMVGPRVVAWLLALAALPVAALAAGQIVAPGSMVAVTRVGDGAAAGNAAEDPRDPAGTPARLGGAGDFDTGPGPDRRLSVLGGAVQFSPHGQPMLGSPDARVIVVEVFDYTCPHCQKMHAMLGEAIQRYGGELGVLTVPAPLDGDCNPYVEHTHERHRYACELARVALRVWEHDRERFGPMHDWLFSHEEPPSPDEAVEHAAALIGRERARSGDEAIEADIARRIEIGIRLQQLLEAPLPVLLAGSSLITGRPQNADELFKILEEETALGSRSGGR